MKLGEVNFLQKIPDQNNLFIETSEQDEHVGNVSLEVIKKSELSKFSLILCRHEIGLIGYVLRTNKDWSIGVARVVPYPLKRWKTPTGQIVEKEEPILGWERMPDFDIYKVTCPATRLNQEERIKFVEKHKAIIIAGKLFLELFGKTSNLLPWYSDDQIRKMCF